MNARVRDALALATWVAFLVAALVGLHALGRGPLAAPPLDDVAAWFERRDAPTAVFAVLRLALVGVAWYLLVSTLLATVLRIARADAAAGVVEACAPAPVRRLVRAAVGLSLAASVVAVSAAAASEGDEPVTMRRLPDAEMRVVEDDEGPVTMTRLPDEVTATPPAEAPTAPSTWTVAPGDHLWSIAERSLAAAWRMTPTDDEIDPFWRQLIADNRQRLEDPANPDLLHPGFRVDVPEPPPKPVG